MFWLGITLSISLGIAGKFLVDKYAKRWSNRNELISLFVISVVGGLSWIIAGFLEPILGSFVSGIIVIICFFGFLAFYIVKNEG